MAKRDDKEYRRRDLLKEWESIANRNIQKQKIGVVGGFLIRLGFEVFTSSGSKLRYTHELLKNHPQHGREGIVKIAIAHGAGKKQIHWANIRDYLDKPVRYVIENLPLTEDL
jgi:hypothetical protein